MNAASPPETLSPRALALACLGLLTGLGTVPAMAQTASAPGTPPAAASSPSAPAATVRSLIDQARHWQGRQRPDLAAQAWQKLLAVDPRQPDALHGLAVLSTEAGRFDEATSYLNRLRQVRPDHPALATLTRQVQTQTATPSMLATARQYAQAGQTEAAAQAYRQALGPQPPTDELALEYYQTLGGTREGWDEARRGLERVTQSQPGQAGPALALAKHLTYRDSTRRDGISRLIALASSADTPAAVRQDARSAWRQALLWMGPRPADVPLYRQYLASVGDDERVRARMAEATQPGRATASSAREGSGGGRPADPQQAASREGFALLNANQLGAATERFEAQLKRRPDDAEALAGLGLVRLRQERFDEAVELLGRAAAGSARWKPVHQTALHWQAVHEADDARQAGDLDRATRLARAAVDANPKEPEAQVLLGDLLAGQGLLPGAEAAYRAALRQDARHPRATLGLVSVLGAAGRTQQASAFVEQIDADLLGRLGGAGALRAAQMRLQAELALQRGDTAGAQALLQQAVTQAPASPWVRLSLGQLLVRQGRLDEARAQLDAFVIPKAPAAQRTEALHARASLQAELRDWAGAQQTLEQVPTPERKGEVARLQRRVAVQAQAAEAVTLARAGQTAQAQWLLTEAETAAGQDAELIGAVAGARTDLGEEARAGQMIRATLAAQPQAGPGLRLRLAALLLQTRQDTELAGLLQQLAGQSLTAAQRRDFDDLRLGFALRQSDLLREQGDLYNAWEAIGPLLQERPREPRLLMALARLHGSAGDHAQARALYEAALQQRADDVDAWLGLAGAADAQKDHETARQALAEAQKLAPNAPPVLAQFARHHRAQGQFRQATEYLRAAVAAEQPARGVQWGQARVAANPFAAYAGRATAQTTMLAGAGLPRAPLVRPDAGFVDVEHLPPTGAGGRPLADSPIARSQRWRAPEPVAAAPTPAPVAGTTRLAAAPGAEPAPPPATPNRTSRRRTLADELAEVQNERGRSHATIGGTITSRTGEAGLGRADLVQTPVEATKVIEEVGLLTVRATPVVITAGRVGADAGSRSRFGTLGLDSTGSASPAEQSDAGVGLSVGLQTRHLSADIGTTPVGFAVVDAVGGVRWRGELDDALRLDIEASRRALTDSVLAFAGTTDTRTGRVWGGVRSTGLRAQLAWEQGDVGFYGYGGAHGLTGREVKTNTRVEVGAGSYWRGRQRADDQLEIGLNLGYQHYRYNLSGYTWGHGGYFSPQHLVALTLPINWYGRSGRLSWGLQGAAGLQVYREEAAPYLPTDAAAQGTLDSLVAQQKLAASTYAARSEAGAIFNLGGALEYQLTRQLDIGTRLGVDVSPQFTQSTGSIYLRFSLEPRAAGGVGLRYPSGPAGY